MKKKTVIILVVIGLLALCVCTIIGVGVYIWYNNQNKPTPSVTVSPSNQPTPTIKVGVTTKAPKVIPTPNIPVVTDTFSDDFSSDLDEWATGDFDRSLSYGTRTISGGVYTIDITAKDGVYNYVYPSFGEVENFRVSVDAKILSLSATTSEAQLGFILKFTDTELYRFLIDPETQEYSFKYTDADGEITKIIDWTYSDEIYSSGFNNIKVVCLDSKYYFYINNVLIDSVIDISISSGEAGLVVDLGAEGDNGVFQFDNYLINSFD